MADLIITKTAKNDIRTNLAYLKEVLLNPKASTNLADEITSEFNMLQDNPKSGPYVQDPFLAKLGFRFLLIKNYKAYYVVTEDESVQEVHIIRFLHSKMNYESILNEELTKGYLSIIQGKGIPAEEAFNLIKRK